MFDNNKVSEKTIIKPAERVEGCELVSIKKDNDPASKSFRSVAFTFVQKSTGSELTDKVFAPSRNLPSKVLSNEELKKAFSLAHSKIAHITRAFLDEATYSKIVIGGDFDQSANAGDYAAIDRAWDEYVKMSAMALGVDLATGSVAKAKGVPCALKVVYSEQKGKYYAALPKVPPFISTDNHPKVFTTNPQYDKYVVPANKPDTENPFGATSANPFNTAAPAAPDFGKAPENVNSGW